jgi:hypothetical protein
VLRSLFYYLETPEEMEKKNKLLSKITTKDALAKIGILGNLGIN